MPSPQQRVLDALQGGLCRWETLRAVTKMNDERLGHVLGELLSLRKIWTGEKNNVRYYGIERRTGLSPRLAARRRSSDSLLCTETREVS